MADDQDDTERTEDPTQKRRDEAISRGDVAKSQEVNTWFVLSGGLLALFAFGASATNDLRGILARLLGSVGTIDVDSGSLLSLMRGLGLQTMGAVAIPLGLMALAAIAGNLIQHRPVLSAESMRPKLDRISPIAGARRLFSKQALVSLAKGFFKLGLIGALMGWLLWPERSRLDGLVAVAPAAMLTLMQSLALRLLAATVAALGFVAALDYFYQYQVWFNRQKMSVRELKEEFRQTEGDPIIRGKLRQMRALRMKKRMMAAVPKASVIITNPTHYAIALQYERGMNAPLCLAKGVDEVARRIREIAQAHDIPIVENPPLARTLHATVEIDQEVPAEHYKAVAEVIAFVMRLRRGVRAR